MEELKEIRARLQDAIDSNDWWVVKSQMNKLDTILYNKNNENSNHLIEFAVYLTGHDKETIEQMYKDWKK